MEITPPPVKIQCKTKFTPFFALTYDKEEVIIKVIVKEIRLSSMAIGIGDNGDFNANKWINADVFMCSLETNGSYSVKRFWLNGEGVPSNMTEVAGASCTQSNGETTMEFKRKVSNASTTESPIKIGAGELTKFLYAYSTLSKNVFQCKTKYDINDIAVSWKLHHPQ